MPTWRLPATEVGAIIVPPLSRGVQDRQGSGRAATIAYHGRLPMVKQLVIVPADVRRPETVELGSIPVNAYRKTLAQEIAAGRSDPGRAPARSTGTCSHPRVREHAGRAEEARRLQGRSPTTTRAPPTSPSARRPPRWGRLPPGRRRPHLRLPPEPRRDHRQGPVRDREAATEADLADDHGGLPGRRHPARVEARRAGARARRTSPSTTSSTAPWRRSSAARRASTGAWAAPCTPSSRPSASCPTTPSSAGRADIAVGRGPLQAGAAASAASSVANIGDASDGLRPGLGGHGLRRHGPVPDAVGARAPAAACRSSSTS